jgi:hypothetical protein
LNRNWPQRCIFCRQVNGRRIYRSHLQTSKTTLSFAPDRKTDFVSDDGRAILVDRAPQSVASKPRSLPRRGASTIKRRTSTGKSSRHGPVFQPCVCANFSFIWTMMPKQKYLGSHPFFSSFFSLMNLLRTL